MYQWRVKNTSTFITLTFSAAPLCRLTAASPAVPRAVEGDVTLDHRLSSRHAHVREEELGGVVFEGVAASQKDAQDHQRLAWLVRAQVHADGWVMVLLDAGVVVAGAQTRGELWCSARTPTAGLPVLKDWSAYSTRSLSGVVRSVRSDWCGGNTATPTPLFLPQVWGVWGLLLFFFLMGLMMELNSGSGWLTRGRDLSSTISLMS